jgi:polyisoprenoid-binding protein YceI
MSAKPVRWIAAVVLSLPLMDAASDRYSSASAQARVYAIVAAQSKFTVLVGKAGLFSGLGHDHTIVVKSFSGRVQVPAAGIAQSSLELEAEAKSLTVADQGISDKERGEIQKAMETEVLEITRFPKISFRSISVANLKPSGNGQSFTLNGDLALHGVTKRIAVPVAVTITPEQLRATGEVTIKQTDFGIKPYSAGLGTVKVKNELKLSFTMVAKAS